MANLEELMQKKRQLEEKIRREKAKISKVERAADTRRKILIGAFISSREDRYRKLLADEDFRKFITRERDRELFDFGDPLETPERPDRKASFEIIPDSADRASVVLAD